MILLDTVTVIVKRHSQPGRYVNGHWLSGTFDEPFDIEAAVQPGDGYKLAPILEGKRIHGVIDIISEDRLYPADPKTGRSGDIVTWDGYDWEVIQVMPFTNTILPHFESSAIRIKEGMVYVSG